MTTLALDLGQNIGWVRGGPVGTLEYGTFALRQTSDLGEWLMSSDEFFRVALKGVTSVAVEQPFLGQDYYPARKLLALLGHCAYWCRFYGLGKGVIQEVAVSTGKKKLSGNGAAKAPEMILAARAWLEDPDEHSAHALGIHQVHLFGPAAKPAARPRSSKGVIVTP